ncbi:Acetyltransferase (GNAT) family protein [Corynebacterium atrinae]|uniref:GNAT family N-acetyltransferase n=1 Tax=Corynebacterium atrinae TaxID=1336740 RepID=UPI0025B3EE36|nr:N-acetyltransferase [Corynebacterium atrinae]WJY62234.1 Acetyltransferase (GNAT) family protein [Corynebacterium atrinae]
MDTFTIRQETEADISAIRDLTLRAFRDVPYSEQKESDIVDMLRDTDALTLSLIAVKGASVVGHIAASPVRVEDGREKWFGIGPISVDPDRQGAGIGSELMARALEELRGIDAGGAVVLGDPTFYQRFGFDRYEELTFPGVDQSYFLAIPLSDAAVPLGTVTYHQAFYL